MTGRHWSTGISMACAVLLAGCASMQQLVSAPDVRLRQVQVERVDVTGQSFLLSFDVTNPNPFPLPISTISYAVALDGHPFASGKFGKNKAIKMAAAVIDRQHTSAALTQILRGRPDDKSFITL